MKRQDFYFELPPELIAQYPLPNRSDSKLLVYSRKTKVPKHHVFHELCDFLVPGDLLVFNDTRVIPARFYGQKPTGGKVEFLLERQLDERTFLAHMKASKALRDGTIVELSPAWQVKVLGRNDALFHCELNGLVDEMLADIGHIPLPPYITREDEVLDAARYQTIYARHKGSVAAPTAGLHFDEAVMNVLRAKGIQFAYATLHVGAGTFKPVKSDLIVDHTMHTEHFVVSEVLRDAVLETKASQHRVIAVGTTALRCLESAARSTPFAACSGETDIFIYPGFEFKVCDGLITNFHLPESTLLMLVSAFIGQQEALALYRLAIENQYRFFSYGDVSLLL